MVCVAPNSSIIYFSECYTDHISQSVIPECYTGHIYQSVKLVTYIRVLYWSHISECYTGHISDKALTKESGFLDELPSYSSIMADKGFNLFDECTARYIHFIVPPGRGGASQMTLPK